MAPGNNVLLGASPAGVATHRSCTSPSPSLARSAHDLLRHLARHQLSRWQSGSRVSWTPASGAKSLVSCVGVDVAIERLIVMLSGGWVPRTSRDPFRGILLDMAAFGGALRSRAALMEGLDNKRQGGKYSFGNSIAEGVQ